MKTTRKLSKKFFYGLGLGALLGLLIGGLTVGVMKDRSLQTRMEEEKAVQEQLSLQRADSIREAQIVDYLDKTEKWTKTETDSVCDRALSGLYDALNGYDFTTLDAKADSLPLGRSHTWTTLKEAVERAKAPEVLKVLQTTRSPYSKDGTITISKYIDVLNQAAGYIPEKPADNNTTPQK